MRSFLWNLLYFHGSGLRPLAGGAHDGMFKADFRSAAGRDVDAERNYSSLFSMQKGEIQRTNLPPC
jgi:hypothetical protein